MKNQKSIRKDKPYGIRLGDMKPVLQREAFEQERSLHYIIVKAVKEYYEKIKHKYITPQS